MRSLFTFLKDSSGQRNKTFTETYTAPGSTSHKQFGTKRAPLIARNEKRLTLVFDYNFNDILAWAEYDKRKNKFRIYQRGGKTTSFKGPDDTKLSEAINEYKKTFIVTKFNNERIMHNLSLIVK